MRSDTTSKITTLEKGRVNSLKKTSTILGVSQQEEYLGEKNIDQGKRRGMEDWLSDSSAPTVSQPQH